MWFSLLHFTKRRRHPRPSCRPRLEALESRELLATFTVFNTLDDLNPGSLRRAIVDANAVQGMDTIAFKIASGAQTINLGTALPALTDPVLIDGSTQPGFVNTPLIVLNGAAAGAGSDGLVLSRSGSTVRDLAIINFGGAGLHVLSGATGSVIAGNYIGTADGSTAAGNQDGIVFAGGAANNTVGGTSAGAGNVISGNARFGVSISDVGTAGNVVQNNLIGTAASGVSALANGINGVSIGGGATANSIGGAGVSTGNLIAGNGDYGVLLTGNTTGNVVQGNLLGLSAAGNALGNGLDGVGIIGAADNTIGGTMAGAGNFASGNVHFGVSMQGAGATGNVIQGNFLGTSISAAGARPNGLDAVAIFAGANLNTVGGTAAGAGNVLSGNNRFGLLLQEVSGNLVQGNFVGTTPGGNQTLANALDGIDLINAPGNTLGGTAVGAGNVISGNRQFGVFVIGFLSSGNVIQDNVVGTNAGATAALPNTFDGVALVGAPNNTIGGTAIRAGNILDGNSRFGFSIFDLFSSGNVVQGNLIGVSGTGKSALGNTFDGVAIYDGATNNTIGGTSAAARNIIAGNGREGVLIYASGTMSNVVLGNYLGTDITGTAALPNADSGAAIVDQAGLNTIGGTVAGAANVIAGNTNSGVQLAGFMTTDNVVQGNLIGTDRSGAVALSNSKGVDLESGANNNTIGGTIGAAGNLISGNNTGVYLGSVTGVVLQGNLIGLSAANAPLPNAAGVFLASAAAFNTIGGTLAGAQNVISGNSSTGVWITSTAGIGNVLEGNLIGTDVTGTVAVANGGGGVAVQTDGNTIGGTTAVARNVISGNIGNGIVIYGQVSGNLVQGNFIGTQLNGTSALANTSDGVLITLAATSNTIGGTTAGTANVIAFNGGNGVLIGNESSNGGLAGAGNAVLGNSIHDNARLGIDLGPNDGVTPNNSAGHTGPNLYQNFPVINSVTAAGGGGTDINVSLGSTANTVFRIEFFANASPDPSNHGEGAVFLGAATVTTGADGNVTQTVQVAGNVTSGQAISATATDPAGNTSEFSLDFIVA